MKIDFSKRSEEEEVMDDFTLAGDDFADVLDQIGAVNRWLGGNKITLHALGKILNAFADSAEIHIIDAGCGNGDMCRAVADLSRKLKKKVHILGVDANAYAVEYAASLSKDYSEIHFESLDIFSQEFQSKKRDILLSTLTVHHFGNDQILELLESSLSKPGYVIINDLHRSKVAYRLFQLVCFVFRFNKMNKEDGLVSILRAFKRDELIKLSEDLKKRIPTLRHEIKWKWAFRYLWILENR